jgi:hypothetical protein
MELVSRLLADLNSEKSEFVLEDAYRSLRNTLASRRGLFDRLSSRGSPRTAEQFRVFESVVVSWDRLHAELGRATKATADFLRKKEAKPIQKS